MSMQDILTEFGSSQTAAVLAIPAGSQTFQNAAPDASSTLIWVSAIQTAMGQLGYGFPNDQPGEQSNDLYSALADYWQDAGWYQTGFGDLLTQMWTDIHKTVGPSSGAPATKASPKSSPVSRTPIAIAKAGFSMPMMIGFAVLAYFLFVKGKKR